MKLLTKELWKDRFRYAHGSAADRVFDRASEPVFNRVFDQLYAQVFQVGR